MFETTLREVLVEMPVLEAALLTAQTQAQEGKDAKGPPGSQTSRVAQNAAVVAATEALEAAEAKLAVVCSRNEYAHAVICPLLLARSPSLALSCSWFYFPPNFVASWL